jgi:hypothetical protein
MALQQPPPLVYIAAPYRASNEVLRARNVALAETLGRELAREYYCYPVMPTRNTAGFDDVLSPREALLGTLHLLAKCRLVVAWDAFGTSSGVQGEIHYAIMHGIPLVEITACLDERAYPDGEVPLHADKVQAAVAEMKRKIEALNECRHA